MTPNPRLERLAELADVVLALAATAEEVPDWDPAEDTMMPWPVALVERARDLATEAKALADRGTTTVRQGNSYLSVHAMDELWRQVHPDGAFRGWDAVDAPEPWPTLAREVIR